MPPTALSAAQNGDNGDPGSRSDDDRSLESETSSGFVGDSSYENSSVESVESSQVGVDAEIPMSPGQAAAIIQGMYRREKAREAFVDRVRQAFEKVYDEETDRYFYYNKIHGTSQWVVPKILLGRPLDPREEWAARKIQGLLRKRRAWGQLLSMLNGIYEKEYDPDTDAWFYVNKITNQSMWEKPLLFGSKEPPTNSCDAALINKEREVAELRKELESKKAEAEEARKALQDRLTEERVRNGDLDPDEAKGRSRHMDEWGVDRVVAWFHGIGYKQYDASLRQHQVDGLLLLHLMNEDWGHLGISSPLTVRRIDVAMQEYRIRFEHKQAGGDDETDNASDASASDTPSELLEDEDVYDDDGDSGDQDEDGRVADDNEDLVSEDDPAELQLDAENISKEIIFEGEERRGRPVVGDVVRIHYTCALQQTDGGGRPSRSSRSSGSENEIIIESSRKNRRRPLEFVVGANQVVKGMDRVVKTMAYGERAKVLLTPAYGYGDGGHPPVIPPGAALVFDVNLLDFWPRPRWQKPLVQVLSKPYSETPHAPPPRVASPVIDGDDGNGGVDMVGAAGRENGAGSRAGGIRGG